MITNLVLTGGPLHDFGSTTGELVDLLAGIGVHSTVTDDPGEAVAALSDPGSDWDLLTFNTLRWKMDADRHAPLRDEWAYELSGVDARAVVDHVTSGGALLALHAAVICFDAQPLWTSAVGAAWQWDRSSHPPIGDVEVAVTDSGHLHPITEGLDDFDIVDEAYGFLTVEPDVEPLLTTPTRWSHPPAPVGPPARPWSGGDRSVGPRRPILRPSRPP